MMKTKWLARAIRDPGALRRYFGVKPGEKIAASDIDSEIERLHTKNERTAKETKLLRRLQLAKTMSGFKH